MEKEIKKLVTKDNIQSLAMIGLLVTSIQIIYLLIKQIIITRKFS